MWHLGIFKTNSEEIQFVLLFWVYGRRRMLTYKFLHFNSLFLPTSLLNVSAFMILPSLVSFLFLSVILWSSEHSVMESCTQHSALTGCDRKAQRDPSPHPVCRIPFPRPLLRLGVSLSTCGSQMEPWGSRAGLLLARDYVERLELCAGLWCWIQPGFPAPHSLSHKDTVRRIRYMGLRRESVRILI